MNSPRRRKPAAPNSIVHTGFGNYRQTDETGKPVGEPMTKEQALAQAFLPSAAPEEAGGPVAAGGATPASEKPTARRRRSKIGEFAMKLSAPQREGETRRFFNDDGNRIAEAKELGYEFVSDKGLQTSGPGSRTSRLVGTKANGEPLHAYLMETPSELYAEGAAEKEAANRRIDEAINAGRDSTGRVEHEYSPQPSFIKTER